MSDSCICIKLEVEGAKMPSYGSEYAAGMDICSCESVVVPSHGRALVSTGFSVSMAESIGDKYYLRIAPRSGLAVKSGITTGAGVIDSDYRGVVKVLLFNHGDEDFVVNPGDRIAQMIMERILRPDFKQVESHEASERGTNGFGSTGI
jgi:deoxyuridine 5'-triphosphate nucleotidohydrolase